MSATAKIFSQPTSRFEKWQSHHLLILILALLLHATLLTIPLNFGSRPIQSDGILSVTFSKLKRAAEAVTSTPANVIRRAEVDPVQAIENDPPPATAIPGPIWPTAQAIQETPRIHITTALLLDSASRREWQAPRFPTTRLAQENSSGALPGNWTGTVLRIFPNRFNDLVLPERVEIIDRWRDPDGTIQVVLHTPKGETLCGRAAPWDPMEPLIEPVMMMRLCGGGGKRKLQFTLPEPMRLE